MPNDDAALVRDFLDATKDKSLREVEAETGVSYGRVRQLRVGEWKELRPATRRKIAAYLEQKGRTGTTEDEITDAEHPLAPALFSRMDVELRLRAQDSKPRKLEALERIKEALAALGDPVPDWIYELKQKVERDEI